MKFKFILIQLLAWTMCTGAFAQTNIVAGGSVMDERGEVLIGVTVSVKENASNGGITDADGRFKLTGIKKNQTLVFSYIGFKDQKVVMTKTDERMRIVLKEDVNALDEVVITSSGKVQKKINVTGAITSVEMKDLNVPASSVSNMLGGRVPGIIAVTRSG